MIQDNCLKNMNNILFYRLNSDEMVKLRAQSQKVVDTLEQEIEVPN